MDGIPPHWEKILRFALRFETRSIGNVEETTPEIQIFDYKK
jgi:hypothetical protein